MKSKTAIAIVLLVASVFALLVAFVLLPHRVKLDDPSFVITKQLKPKFTKAMPPWLIEYDITVTYVGKEPIFSTYVGSQIEFKKESPQRKLGGYYTLFPGDSYASHINDDMAEVGVSFDYTSAKLHAGEDGSPYYRIDGKLQSIQIDF